MENNYQLSRIHNYVMGLMNREDMHAIEREAMDDPFLQDAIDGYKLQQGVDSVPLSLLQKRLAARIEQKAIERDRRFYTWQRLSVGLVAAVMFVVVCSLIFFRYMGDRQLKTREVLLMEEEYRITMYEYDGSTAVPFQGWEVFKEELNSEIREFGEQETVRISFTVDNTRAKDIHIYGTGDEVLKEVLQDFIRDKTHWQGEKADWELIINRTGR